MALSGRRLREVTDGECAANRESLESEICSSHIAARGGAGPWRAQHLADRVCLQVGG